MSWARAAASFGAPAANPQDWAAPARFGVLAHRPHGLTNEPRKKRPIRTDVENALAQGCDARIDVTITDEGPMAQAVVVISAVPRAP